MVGVGGWAYFPIRGAKRLEVCSKLYDFAEVNSTFYRLPPLIHAKRWRATVPDTFEFTVRANRELTHVGLLEPTTKNFKIFENVLAICKELRARVLHFQFPPSLEPSDKVVNNWRQFMSSVDPRQISRRFDLYFAFEVRSAKSGENRALRSFYETHDIIPSADATKTDVLGVSSSSRILYSRVFGHGDHTKWSFDTEELKDLAKKVEQVPAAKRYVTFHNLTMYEDASRMKNIIGTGNDRIPSHEIGIDSLKGALASAKVKYPATKAKLLSELGWKTYDAAKGRRVHVSKALEKLPDNEFQTFDDVLKSLVSAEPASTQQ